MLLCVLRSVTQPRGRAVEELLLQIVFLDVAFLQLLKTLFVLLDYAFWTERGDGVKTPHLRDDLFRLYQ